MNTKRQPRKRYLWSPLFAGVMLLLFVAVLVFFALEVVDGGRWLPYAIVLGVMAVLGLATFIVEHNMLEPKEEEIRELLGSYIMADEDLQKEYPATLEDLEATLAKQRKAKEGQAAHSTPVPVTHTNRS